MNRPRAAGFDVSGLSEDSRALAVKLSSGQGRHPGDALGVLPLLLTPQRQSFANIGVPRRTGYQRCCT